MKAINLEPGLSVRLERPENPKHPRAGRVGKVVTLKPYDPVWRERNGERKLVQPACVLCWIRFPPEGDAWDSPIPFGVFDSELSVVEPSETGRPGPLLRGDPAGAAPPGRSQTAIGVRVTRPSSPSVFPPAVPRNRGG